MTAMLVWTKYHSDAISLMLMPCNWHAFNTMYKQSVVRDTSVPQILCSKMYGK